ncbi:MAG: hypothetical protein JXA57_05860 [Armatimonadetes bacterium]|nr:hypothetical protein [Armatimonadota bacterium]
MIPLHHYGGIMDEIKRWCKACGEPIENPHGSRAICSKCGSNDIDCKMVFDIPQDSETSMRAKARKGRPGESKPFLELSQGDIEQQSGETCYVERRVDRENDWYDEVVTNPDGTIKHECHEPLREHRGHGSAKKGGK